MSIDGRASRAPGAAWGSVRPLLVPLALLVLSGVLLTDPWPRMSPVALQTSVPGWATDTSPVRRPVLKPEITLAGFRYRCGECHRLMPSPPETDRPLTEHRHIRLDHGINARCFNCHLRDDRNAFADDRGEAISYDQPQLVCAKCHGPVYRDWTHGVHGRTNGHWSPQLGSVRRLRCVECHDPHAPAFEALRPAPGPSTLRMGDQRVREGGLESTKNPLLIYRRAEPEGKETGRVDSSQDRDHER